MTMPVAPVNPSGELVCGAIGPDGTNALFANFYDGSSWAGWGSVGGKGFGSPSCATLTTGKAICLVLGTNNQLTSTVGP